MTFGAAVAGTALLRAKATNHANVVRLACTLVALSRRTRDAIGVASHCRAYGGRLDESAHLPFAMGRSRNGAVKGPRRFARPRAVGRMRAASRVLEAL